MRTRAAEVSIQAVSPASIFDGAADAGGEEDAMAALSGGREAGRGAEGVGLSAGIVAGLSPGILAGWSARSCAAPGRGAHSAKAATSKAPSQGSVA
jgi:hypothetical protein